jgi:two-component system cell cycle response regulator
VSADILVVEDNPASLELMTYLLTAFGHRVRSAPDGEAALEAARRRPPDLIVCDVHLPRLDGYELARRLKDDPALRGVPLVAVTALAMVGDREKLLAAGFDSYLAKPIDPETFVNQLERFLPPARRGRPRAAPAAVGGRAPALPAEPRATLLVVDNAALNLDVLRATLEPSGYRLVVASSVAEALAQARQVPADLILCDMHLHGESGYDLLRAVRADP